MKKLFFLALLIMGTSVSIQAQKYFTREGKITFTSEAPVERIEATNQSATAVLDAGSGRLEFAALIKAFQFEKALMQEHFNENYMESDTYPKSTFKGQIANAGSIDWTKDGSYPVQVSGELTIHGVTQTLSTPAVIKLVNGLPSATAEFTVAVADYDIEIPAVVVDNIAKEVTITVDVALQALNK